MGFLNQNYSFQDQTIYNRVLHLKDELAGVYKTKLGLTESQIESMCFRNAFKYSDILVAKMFEHNDSFGLTSTQIHQLDLTQKHGLLDAFSPHVSKLYVTRVLRRPLQIMREITNTSDQKDDFLQEFYGYPTPSTQHLVYSAHDLNVALILEVLGFNSSSIAYSGYFELSLLQKSKQFLVAIRYNGRLLLEETLDRFNSRLRS